MAGISETLPALRAEIAAALVSGQPDHSFTLAKLMQLMLDIGETLAAPQSVSAAGHGVSTSATASFNAGALTAALLEAQEFNGVSNATVPVVLPSGVIPWTSTVSVPAGVGLVGFGGSINTAAGTRLLAADSTSQIKVTGSAGRVCDFVIDGNGVATQPFLDYQGVGRYFESVNVVNAAGDNWVVQYSQNNQYNKCQSQGAGGRGLVLDLGCGGLLFNSFESNGNAGGLLIEQSGTSGFPYYSAPTHITFLHSLFERQTTDQHAIEIAAGDAIYFDHIVQDDHETSGSTASITYVHGTAHATFASSRWFGTGTSQTAIQLADSAQLTFLGLNELFTAGSVDIDCPSGTTVTNMGVIKPPSGRAYIAYAGGNAPDATVGFTRMTPVISTRQNATDYVSAVAVATEAGQRFRQFADGSQAAGSGADFNFDTKWGRGGANLFAITGGINLGDFSGTARLSTWGATGVPSNAGGSNNDWCLSDNGHLYFKASGAWVQKI